MGKPKRLSALLSIFVITLALANGCESGEERTVVIYTAHDQVFSRTILDRFEKETGIRVLAQYDTEATKTTGLVERLRRERKAPRCDVFWNNEILRTIRLAREDTFTPYRSPNAESIPAEFRDAAGLWTGFAARARALAFNPERFAADEVPRSHDALLDPAWRERIVIANPEFGTTGTHLAILFATRGETRARAFLKGLADNGVRVVAGNSTSRDRVVAGEAAPGMTDTDDVEVVRRRGEKIDDALYEEDGVILIPNTVAMVKGGPNPEEAKKLIDFLLSPEVEESLAASSSRQIPLHPDVPVPDTGLRLSDLKRMPIDYGKAADMLDVALKAARELLR